MTDTAASPRWIEYLPVADIIPANRNPKDHDPDALSASLGAFGFIEPAVIDERTGRLLAGHGRQERLAEMEAGAEDPPEGVTIDDKGRWLMPVVRGVTSTDDEHAEAMGVALNRVGERGGWKPDLLAEVLDSLYTPGLLDAAGWSSDALDDLLAANQEAVDVTFDAGRQRGTAPGSESYREPTTGERLDVYRDKAIRSLVLDYNLADYERITGMAAAARGTLGVDSNAELFMELLARL